MTLSLLALLAAAGFVSGFVDAIAGGGGLITLPALALAGLDPVAAVATNKLGAVFGSGSSTLAFHRAGKIDAPTMAAPAFAALIGSAFGALALPYAPRQALADALPFVLIAVALYFAFAPPLDESLRRARIGPRLYALTLAPAIGFYDGVFGPGAGSFYMIALLTLAGCGLIGGDGGRAPRQFRLQPRLAGDLRLRRPYRRRRRPGGRARRLPRRAARRRLGAEGRRAAGPAADRRRQRRAGAEARQRAGNAACASG